MRYLILATFLCLSTFVKAETIVIEGTAEAVYHNKPFYLWETGDAISGKKQLVAKGLVNDLGKFSIEFDCKNTSEYILSIDRISGRFYGMPGQNYSLFFPNLPEGVVRTFSGANEVDLVFYDLTEKDPNLVIGNFNRSLEEFAASNVDIAFTNAYLKGLLDFWKAQAAKVKELDAFSKNYVHFACANALLDGGMDKRKIYEYFLQETELVVNNPELGVFLQDYFSQILEETDRLSGDQVIKITVNVAPRAYKILEELKKNDYLADLKLRELVALQGLKELSSLEGYNKKNIVDLVNQIEVRSIYEDVKRVAKNLSYQLTWLKPGFKLPDFELKSVDGELVTPEKFVGKPTMYFFWAPWSTTSLNEMVQLVADQPNWKKDMNVVLVSVAESKEAELTALNAVPNNNFVKLNTRNQPEVIETYQIKSVPHFLLVDKDGKVVRHYASSLDEIRGTFKKLP
ncbi:TlpA family protein disulfide reductase [Luteibaculum oceani]|uniref:TlpA family protein disulfide reductase n=1 Tax=Luteibaculum oceani TaxID=1294296 RepID=A0A5C6VAZ6_9FLAO|nr:TlpA disulfide reductase family protein [Luteibaculum oceani]TXC81751.1 TlpA family protein disulfide reductase [Luteibaculum oceani]